MIGTSKRKSSSSSRNVLSGRPSLRERAVPAFGGHNDAIYRFENEMRGVTVHSNPNRGWFSQVGLAVYDGGWKGRLELVSREKPAYVTFTLYVDQENGTRNISDAIASEPILVRKADFEDDPGSSIYLYESPQWVSIRPQQHIGVIVDIGGTVISPSPVLATLSSVRVVDLTDRVVSSGRR